MYFSPIISNIPYFSSFLFIYNNYYYYEKIKKMFFRFLQFWMSCINYILKIICRIKRKYNYVGENNKNLFTNKMFMFCQNIGLKEYWIERILDIQNIFISSNKIGKIIVRVFLQRLLCITLLFSFVNIMNSGRFFYVFLHKIITF